MLIHAAPRRLVMALFVIGLLLAVGKIAWSNCPECYADQPPMNGHGPAEDGSGRRTITISIDASWGTQQPTRQYGTPLLLRLREWNNARDAYGNSTGYYLDFKQTHVNPDIKITQGDTGGWLCWHHASGSTTHNDATF